jgi:hypothetical protein
VRFRNAAITVAVFAITMAYIESAVVVYLQKALAIDPDRLFPLREGNLVGNLVAIEVGREFATLVMLAGIGYVLGRHWQDRLAWTSVAFGGWDLMYYFWLWIFIGWPHSPETWDVLFLIPLPWTGPVWAPSAVSLALIGFGLAAAYRSASGRTPKAGLVEVAGAVAGGVLVVASFLANAPALLGGGLPGPFPWPLFATGMGLASVCAVRAMRSGEVGSQGPT